MPRPAAQRRPTLPESQRPSWHGRPPKTRGAANACAKKSRNQSLALTTIARSRRLKNAPRALHRALGEAREAEALDVERGFALGDESDIEPAEDRPMAKPWPESPVATMRPRGRPTSPSTGMASGITSMAPAQDRATLRLAAAGKHMAEAGERAGDEIGVRRRIPGAVFSYCDWHPAGWPMSSAPDRASASAGRDGAGSSSGSTGSSASTRGAWRANPRRCHSR